MVSLHDVHVPWGSLQTVINVCTIVTSFCTFLPLGYVTSYFSWQCVLYADIYISNVNSTAIFVDKEHTVWGSTSTCYFSTYSPVFGGIHAFIWCWYFLLMKGQLKSDHQEFPLLVVSFLLHGIMCVVIFVASSMITSGIDIWCHNLVEKLQGKQSMLTCPETQKMDWPNVYTDGRTHPIYSFLLTAKVSCWLQTLTILCQTLVCGYKLYKWILGTIDLRKCARSNSIDTSQCNDGYNSDQDDIDEADKTFNSLESGSYRCLSEVPS